MAVGTEFVIDQLKYVVLTESGTTGTVYVTHKDTNISGDIVIPETVTNGGISYTVTQIYNANNGAFANCTKITSLYIPKTIITTTLEGYWYGIASYATKLRSINIDPENQSYTSIDGVVYNKDITTVLKYPMGKLDLSYNNIENIDILSECLKYNFSLIFLYLDNNNISNINILSE